MYISHGLLLEMVLQKKWERGRENILFFREFSLRPLLSPAKEIERSKGQQKSYLDPPPSLLSISCAGRCVSHFDPPHPPTPLTPHPPTKVQRRRTSGQTFFFSPEFLYGNETDFFLQRSQGRRRRRGRSCCIFFFLSSFANEGKGEWRGNSILFLQLHCCCFPRPFFGSQTRGTPLFPKSLLLHFLQ